MRRTLAILLALLASACGGGFDASRINGPSLAIGFGRDRPEAILPACRLEVPRYAPDGEPERYPVARTFSFRGERHTISVALDRRLVEASRTIGTERCVMSAFDADDFYEGLVFDPTEERFFDALLAELRSIRDARGLDASGYAELLAAFVQSLEYAAGDNIPKHPIAAFADGEGDCDETSALLAGLLAREGYDVCLFLFLEAEHMAVGLRADGIGYRGTGYAYIEATAPSYIGRAPLGGLAPAPELIRVGDGDAAYTPSRAQRYLAEVARFAEREIEELAADDPPEPRLAAAVALAVVLMAKTEVADACAAVAGLLGGTADPCAAPKSETH